MENFEKWFIYSIFFCFKGDFLRFILQELVKKEEEFVFNGVGEGGKGYRRVIEKRRR